MTDRTRGKGPAQSSSSGARARSRSGDFSGDPRFDADELFEVIGAEAGAEQVAAAMRQFVVSGDEEGLASAIAIYARSARARGEPVEHVLATINGVVDAMEGTPAIGAERDPSRLRQLVMRGLLLTFFGTGSESGAVRAPEQRRSHESSRPSHESDEG